MAGGLKLDEFALIARYFAPLARDDPNAFALTDDAALVLERPGHDLVVTKDAIVSGVHFLPDDPPDAVAKKLLRVNLSDLAAKGAEPYGYLMATAFPDSITEAWLQAFVRGLAEDQAEYGIHLLGGDTVRTTGPLTLSLTALGFVPRDAMITRAGAKPGDLVFVSGTIGDAALGLAVLKKERMVAADVASVFVARYRLPQPRVRLGLGVRGLAHAAIDVSDGLLADVAHVADCSGVQVEIALKDVPLSPEAAALVKNEPALIRALVTAGDDYELIIAAPAQSRAALSEAAARAGVPLTAIGHVEAGQGLSVLGLDGKALALGRLGFRHF